MAGAAVVFDAVWKKFRLGERHDSLRDLIPATVRKLRRGRSRDLDAHEFWAIRDLAFEVPPGEALGIIGPNGAGKSTVLKLLTKIMKPTRGACRVQGRAGALIELAAGFHPDLTGRENIFLQGAIMGMGRAEVARQFDEIVDFSGVHEFVDTPVKRYSSGMQARLGFAVAAHLEPDVLLIDEVLSVGDMRFQERCLERMLRFKAAGVAIVFVSHNLSAISTLCDRVLVLKRGTLHNLGDVQAGLLAYASMPQEMNRAAGVETALDIAVELRDGLGRPLREVRPGDDVCVRAIANLPETGQPLGSGIKILSLNHRSIAAYTLSTSIDCPPVVASASTPVEFSWTFQANLTRGHYSVEFIVFDVVSRKVLCRLTPGPLFAVNENESQSGPAYLNPRCSVVAAIDQPCQSPMQFGGEPVVENFELM
jgi:homopolymeric O-antigen transport system ATP-binding protein